MSHKIFSSVIVLIALVVAVLACTVSIDSMDSVMIVAKFFDVMLPILAVGALLKYLCCCGKCSKCGESCKK